MKEMGAPASVSPNDRSDAPPFGSGGEAKALVNRLSRGESSISSRGRDDGSEGLSEGWSAPDGSPWGARRDTVSFAAAAAGGAASGPGRGRNRRNSSSAYAVGDIALAPTTPAHTNVSSNASVMRAVRLLRKTADDDKSSASGMGRDSKGGALRGGLLAKSEQTIERLNNALKSKAFQPDDKFQWYWDTVIMVFLAYYGIFVPCHFAMERGDMVAGEWGHLAVEVIATMVFAADILVRMHTVYIEEATGKLVEDISAIRRHYMKNGFWRDIWSALPIDLIVLYSVDSDVIDGWTHTILFALLKMPKFLIIQDLFRVLTPVKLSPFRVLYHFTVVPMLRLLFYCALAINMITVLWMIINKNGVRGTGSEEFSYITSLYWTLYTVTTVGYGDVPVDSPGKKLFACLLFITGVIVHGIVISKISSRMQKGDVESERTDTMKETLSVLKKFAIPEQLACEVLAFQYHQLHSDVSGGFMKVLQGLPSVMRNRVSLFVRIKLICFVPMFREQPIECLVGLANALKSLIYEPERRIIKAGDDGREMFFLGHGFAEVTSPVGDPWGVIRPGGFFGEIALLTDSKRTASISTLTYCELFRLDKGDFFVLIRKHPEMKEAVALEMRKRQIQINSKGTVYKLEMEHPSDYIGIEWEEYGEGNFIAAAVDDHGAGARAGIVQGMHLVSIDDECVDSIQTLQLVDDTFHGLGMVSLTLLPPTMDDTVANDEAGDEPNSPTIPEPGGSGGGPGAAAAAGGPGGGDETVSRTFSTATPFALDLTSQNEQGSNGGGSQAVTPRRAEAAAGRGLHRVESETSFTSAGQGSGGGHDENSPTGQAAQRQRRLSRASGGAPGRVMPEISVLAPPGGRGSVTGAGRTVGDLLFRMVRIEEKQQDMGAALARVETMTQALLNTLGLVVEKDGGDETQTAGGDEDPQMPPPTSGRSPRNTVCSAQGRRPADLPALNPPPDKFRAPDSPGSSSCVRSIQSLQEGSLHGSVPDLAMLRTATQPLLKRGDGTQQQQPQQHHQDAPSTSMLPPPISDSPRRAVGDPTSPQPLLFTTSMLTGTCHLPCHPPSPVTPLNFLPLPTHQRPPSPAFPTTTQKEWKT